MCVCEVTTVVDFFLFSCKGSKRLNSGHFVSGWGVRGPFARVTPFLGSEGRDLKSSSSSRDFFYFSVVVGSTQI